MKYIVQTLLLVAVSLVCGLANAQFVGGQAYLPQGDLPPGCTDPTACNFNTDAVVDDGSCLFGPNQGITNSAWVLYLTDCANPLDYIPETISGPFYFNIDGTISSVEGMMFNYVACGNEWSIDFEGLMGYGMYDPELNVMFYEEPDNGFCGVFAVFEVIPGCTDENAMNYNSDANENDGSCLYTNSCDDIFNADGVGLNFTGAYYPWNWIYQQDDGGSIDFSETDLYIVGSDTENDFFSPLTQVSIEVSDSGEFSFDWDYFTNDDDASYDIAYFLNGERIELSQVTDVNGNPLGNEQNGSVTFTANAGDIIGFGIDATDNCCGEGNLHISNFTYPVNCTVACDNPLASNYDPTADSGDNDLCVFINACGDEVYYNAQGYGMVEAFDPIFWNVITEGNGSVDIYEDGLSIYGSDNDSGMPALSQASIIAPYSGMYYFSWDYNTNDADATTDVGFFINGTASDLSQEFDQFGNPIGNNGQNGFVYVYVEAGDELGFGLNSLNDCCGAAELNINYFSWPINCIAGCLDETATNYNAEADVANNNECLYLNDCGNELTSFGNIPGLIGDYAPELWNETSQGSGSIEFNDEGVIIFGSDGGFGSNILTEITIEALVSGTYTFDWKYITIDGPAYDEAYYYVNESILLTQVEDEFGNYFNGTQSGSASISVVAGDIIGFGINATDDCCGLGMLIITNFTQPGEECLSGCMDETACNYDATAIIEGDCDFESCVGCMDQTACNYDAAATIDSGCDFESCVGCMDETACNYDAAATIDSGCDFESCLGCMDETACNYDAAATIDSSCDFESCVGCMDETACNYDAAATIDSGCDFESCAGCMDPTACNYDAEATIDSGCDFESCAGCMDETACNYDAAATIDSGCDFESCAGCMDETACNYDAEATIDSGCDFESCAGCMDETACNYDAEATIEGDCDFETCAGCMDETACNYDAEATIEGDCDFESCAGCTDDSALNFDPNATIDDGSCEFCELPSVSFEVTGCSDGQFMVEVTVDGVGAASPFTLSNDVNDFTSDVSEDGTITAGPFEVGTFVTFTLASNEFESCSETYETQGCPDNVSETNELTFVVYPNPTTGAVVIATNATGTAVISLFDLSGKVVLEQQAFFTSANLTLDLSSLAAGAYQLRVINANMVSTQQVIVQK
jgi:hypothetical protein